MRRSTIFSFVCSMLLIAAGWYVIVNRQDLIDRWQLLNYQPTSAAKALAEDDRFSDKARSLFFASHPTVDDKSSFAGHCPVGEQTIVLGCYASRQIFVLQVNDPQLNGVEQVSAAHEMLHAAYQRLSPSQQHHINQLVEAAYANIHDARLAKTIQAYQQSEPGQQDNELHSILGTEFSNLSPELETYYKTYFTDRSRVVSLANAYQSVFTGLEDQVDSYDQQLTAKKTAIERLQNQLDASRQTVESERSRLDALINGGNTAAYNGSVASFNQLVNAYNAQVSQLQADITAYNALVVARNKLATAQRDLTHSLQATYQPLGQ